MYLSFPNTGFTLLETLIALSLLSTFAIFELSNGTDSYERTIRRVDQQLLVSAIRKSRSDAIQGVCTNPNCNSPVSHGIRVTRDQLVLFEGNSYLSRYTPADITLSYGAPEDLSNTTSAEIVFAPISGDVLFDQIISVTGPDHHTESVSINTDGMIAP
jgi:prepilin-type N-terminal cleavage/methylation domain-containing protein